MSVAASFEPRRAPSACPLACGAALGLLFGACEPAPPIQPARSAHSPSRWIPVRKVAHTRVFDENGQARACDVPLQGCPERPHDRTFLDQCRLHGYYVRQCGCDVLCTGKVELDAPCYDARGEAKNCTREARACGANPASNAQFEDACIAAGHRLVQSGCEWLCSGKAAAPR